MTNVGALSYKLSSNVAGFKDGMTLSRSELAMTRRAFLDSRSDAEKLQYKLDTLEKAFKAGVGTEEQYNAAKASTLAKSKEGIAAAQREAELMRQASELTRRMMTDEERLADERSRLINLRPHLAATAYARAMAELDARMPDAIQAEKERADAIAKTEAAQKRAQQIIERMMTDEERLANERRELESLQPHLSTEHYARAMADLNARMPEAIQAERERADAMARTEAAQRRAQQIIDRLITDEERLANERRELESLQPHLSTEHYARAMADLNARMPEAIQAERERADSIARTEAAQRRAQQITERLMTDEERLANERRELESLQPHLSTEHYARAMADLNARMPEAIQAERERADAMARTEAAQRRAQQIIDRLITDEERLANERRELESLQPHLSTEQYARAMADLNARMPETVRAEKERADAMARADEIVKRLMTDEERLANERRELEALKPHLSTEQYARAMADLNARMPEAIRSEQRLQREQQQLNDEMAEGRRLTQSLETATERYAREIDDLDRMLRRGAISQETYGRAVSKAKGDLANNSSELASHIPMVGNLSNSLLTGAARFGPYGAAAIAVSATLYGFGRAVGFVSDQISRQMELVDQQHETASQLMVDLESFQTLVFAGAKQSGASEDQIGAMLGKLQLNFAKAAQGNEKLRETIQGLGLDVDQLASKDATVIFREVSQAISEMQSPGEQMKAIFELAGKQGITMADTFRLGAEGIGEMNTRAAELNMLMSEADAEQLALANDAWNEMGMAVDNVWNKLAVEFAPAVQIVAMGLETVIDWVKPLVHLIGLLPDAALLATGLMADLYETGAGILTLDWDRVASGLNGDQTIGMIKAKEAFVAMNKAKGDQLRVEKEQQGAQIAALEAASEMQGAGKSKDDPVADVNKEIEALKAKNLELAMGKDWVEQNRIANLQVEPMLKYELEQQMAINKELEKKKKLEEEAAKAKKEAEDRAKREKDQLKAKADQLAESIKSPFDKVVDEIADIRKLRSVGAIDERTARQAEMAARKRFTEGERKDVPASAPTANRGTREAYQLIVENAKAERDAVEARHREQMAEQAIANALAERTAIATERMQPVGGV
jgi:hypothetical protein